MVPMLEEGSGLIVGEDFFVDTARAHRPRQSGLDSDEHAQGGFGINRASLEQVDRFYRTLVERTVRVSGTHEAELSKLLENTFRHVNIALVNELAGLRR